MTLLSYITLILSIAIFVSILFGCTYKKRFERFETEKSDDSKSDDSKSDDSKSDDSKSVSEKKNIVLTEEEKTLLKGLQSGSIDEKKLEKFIDQKLVDKVSVEKIINYIQENFENEINK